MITVIYLYGMRHCLPLAT